MPDAWKLDPSLTNMYHPLAINRAHSSPTCTVLCVHDQRVSTLIIFLFKTQRLSIFNKWHATQKHIKGEHFIRAAVVVFHTGGLLFCIRCDDCACEWGGNEWCLMWWTVIGAPLPSPDTPTTPSQDCRPSHLHSLPFVDRALRVERGSQLPACSTHPKCACQCQVSQGGFCTG